MSQPTSLHLRPGPPVILPTRKMVDAVRTFWRPLLGLALAVVIGASLVAAVIGAQGRFAGTPAQLPAPTLVTRERPVLPLPVDAQPTPYPTPAGA